MTVSADALQMDQAKTAGDLIAAGNQLLTIRTQHQLSVAITRPRDEARFASRLAAEAAEAGEDFFYSIPFKDHKPGCADRRNCNCPSKPVAGPGVGLARSAARLWGNCSVDTTLERDGDDAWLVGAWFIDFESNYTKHEVKRVSKMKATRGGGMVRAGERDLDLVYQIGASKVERDVILRALPKHAIEKAYETAKYAALMDKAPVPEQVARLLRRFNELGVSLAQVERYLKRPFTPDGLKAGGEDPREVLAHLRGLITAIKGGDVDPAEVFAEGLAAAAPAGVSVADLVAPAAPVVPEAEVVGDGVQGEQTPSGSAGSAGGAAVQFGGPAVSASAPSSAPAEVRPYDELFALLVEVAKVHPGRVFVKEAPKGGGRYYLVDPECAKALGIDTGAKVAEAGEVDLVLAGRLTAWLKARL